MAKTPRLNYADASNPGLLTAGAQDIPGVKTFSSPLTGNISKTTAVAIGSTAAGVNITTHTDSGDDFTVNNNILVVKGDTGRVAVAHASPKHALHVAGCICGGYGVAANTTIAKAYGQSSYLVLLSNQYDAGSAVRSALYHIIINYEGTAIAFSGLIHGLNNPSYSFDVSGGNLRVTSVMAGNNTCSVFST